MDAVMFLTDEELYELTGAKRRGTRVRILRAMGIEHRVRPDGRVIVLRKHVEILLGGTLPTKAPQSPEPNWAALEQWKDEKTARVARLSDFRRARRKP
jgi:hypothetical protein